MSVKLGCDFGGRSTKAAGYRDGNLFFTADCELASETHLGPERGLIIFAEGFENVLDRMGSTPQEVTGIGVGIAGLLSSTRVLGMNSNFNHPGWAQFPLADRLEELLLARWKRKVSVKLIHDATALALFEHHTRCLSGKRALSLLAVTSGTGFGGGFVNQLGAPLIGSAGRGPEVGHTRALTDTFFKYQSFLQGAVPTPCPCCRELCAELFASIALQRWALPFALWQFPNHPLTGVPTEEAIGKIRSLAEQGNSLCQGLFFAQAYGVGLGIANLNAVLAADVAVVDGGLVNTTPEMREQVRQHIYAGYRHAVGSFSNIDTLFSIELAEHRDDRGTACGAAIYAA